MGPQQGNHSDDRRNPGGQSPSADPGGLRTLLEVQEHDTALDRLRHRRQTLPERTALDQAGQQMAELAARWAEAEGRLAELSQGQAHVEADIASVGRRIVDIESRLYGGMVSASRELQAMAAEVQSLQRRRTDMEDRALEVMEQTEPVEAELVAIREERASMEVTTVRLEEAVAAAEAVIDAGAVEESSARAALAIQLPGELKLRYEALRKSLGGVGAAQLVNGCCQGCHLRLPAIEVDRIRHLPPGTVATCEQCDRILVY
ncbi:MAG: hypothetical protein DLM54_09015 [Acidimicrobiales bacterium]|nr:MAG: hypothetical protein DLM54_09015 [Acidimicrobiales bacterium]